MSLHKSSLSSTCGITWIRINGQPNLHYVVASDVMYLPESQKYVHNPRKRIPTAVNVTGMNTVISQYPVDGKTFSVSPVGSNSQRHFLKHIVTLLSAYDT